MFDFDLTGKLVDGINVLALKIIRPSKNNDMPYKNPNTELAFTFVDWAPNPPDGNAGIWREVTLTNLKEFSPIIRHPVVNTKLVNGTAELEVTADVTGVGNLTSPGLILLKLNGADYNNECYLYMEPLQSLQTVSVTFTRSFCTPLTIKNPKLWWPWSMGD
jgi:exo-1,4-beta-D-glucosaminidase